MGLAAKPRHPEQTLLYQTVAGHLETFLAGRASRDRPVPGFVERRFRAFLDCGVLAGGFLRLRCASCGDERLVAFSCKGRVWCPSCGGRRMSDTAAHLVDRVFPAVPVRQWVLSLPFAIRYRTAWDAGLTIDILGVFIRALFGELVRRARERYGLAGPRCGSVTFIQRFGDSLNLNPHFHCLALDGVYAAGNDGTPHFFALPAPEDADVLKLAARVARRVTALLGRRGLGPGADPEQADPLSQEDPATAALLAHSVRRQVAVGPRTGQALVRLGTTVDMDMGTLTGARCAMVSGFSVHANVGIRARDRLRLERLCRYAGRPAVATERLSRLQAGRLLYRLKRPWRDGTEAVVFEPQDFIAKLAALTPAPRAHLIRYHGVLGPAASWRAAIVPETAREPLSAGEPGRIRNRPPGPTAETTGGRS